MRALLLVVATALVMRSARAGDEPPPAPVEAAVEVERWIRDLASEQYEVREAARKGLERRGREAPEVLKAHVDDADPEVRRTVRALLERLGASVSVPPAPGADVARVGLVSLQARGRALGEVLDELSATLGGTFVVDADSARRPVTVDVAEAPYFAALEALVAAAGLKAPTAFDSEGRLALVPAVGGGAANASATAGPLRVKPLRVSAARTLDGQEVRTHTLTLDLHLAPCVQLVNHRTPRVGKAVDAAGRAWRPSGHPSAALIHGVGFDVRRVELNVALEPTEGAQERLALLELTVPLRLRHERRSVRFPAVTDLPRTLDEKGRPAEAGAKGAVTLAAVTPAEGRKDAWLVDLSAVPSTAVGRESMEALLVTSDGAKRRLWLSGSRSTTSADGRLRLVGRCFQTAETSPVAVEVVWFEREGEGEAAFALTDVPLR